MRTKAERLDYCKSWFKKLERQYAPLITKRTKALKFRDANPDIVAVIENRSKITTTDMQDAIDMAKPDILETLAGVDEPLKLDPDEAKWVEPVKKLQVLGNVMVKRKNKWFRICSDFLDDSMVLQFGCIKYRWVEETKTTEKVYENLDPVELQATLQANPAGRLSGTEEKDGKAITKIAYDMSDEYVRYDVVPSERIRFPLDTRDFAEAPMVIEELRLYEHEFVKLFGEKPFNKVRKIKESLDSDKPDSAFMERFKHVGGLNFVFDKKEEKYKAYECYFWEDKTPWFMCYSADEVLKDEENKYGKPPYRGGSPFLIAHSLIGKGYLDYLESIQCEHTYLKRQITDIVSQNAFRRYFANIGDSGMNIKDYENNSAMNALIRCDGDISERNIREEKKTPLYPEMFEYLEMLKIEKDERIPTPRAYGGLEGAKDERTYRGKQLKVNQASKKLLLMMRSYMEEVFAPLFQDTLECIAKFMKKTTVVRYLNEDYNISPEDIICKYALVVNVGLGSHDKQDLVVKLQQLIQLSMTEMQTGIITAQNLFYMHQELVKAMGFLNTMDFVTDPKLKETIMQLVQMIAMFMNHMAGMHEDPEMMQAMDAMNKMIQQVMQALGIQQEPEKGGQNAKGTQTGQEPAAIQEQPANTFPPQTRITGGDFHA